MGSGIQTTARRLTWLMMDGCAGLGRLQKEVRTCEYSDVHVMWEMLSKQPTTGVRDDDPPPSPPARTGRAAAAWSRLASYCCAL
jgi:hypothetical protein